MSLLRRFPQGPVKPKCPGANYDGRHRDSVMLVTRSRIGGPARLKLRAERVLTQLRWDEIIKESTAQFTYFGGCVLLLAPATSGFAALNFRGPVAKGNQTDGPPEGEVPT